MSERKELEEFNKFHKVSPSSYKPTLYDFKAS